ncbi:MAG: ATP-binding protein [Prolixibacteraceae bacterium]
MADDKLKILVSSTVYGSDSDLDQIKYTLEGFGYEVVMSKEGRVYVAIDDDPTAACLKAVEDCDLFLGITNALMHRDYSSFSSSVSISVYPDKFVISNSGRLPDDIKISDLKKNHDSHPVNPDIAHVVFLRGLIDKLGRGTIRVIEECKDAGLKVPEWKETSTGDVLTFHGPKNLAERKERIDAVNDSVNDAIKSRVRDAVSDAINDAASDAVIERLINEVLLLFVEDGKSLKDLMLAFDVARATMQRDMSLLKAHRFIVFEGAAKSGVYRLTEGFKSKLDFK